MPAIFEIIFAKSAKKSLKKIPLPWRERIGDAVNALERNPFYGEKMWGKLYSKRKIRIWPYRIIYKIDENKKIVKILKIDHRGSIGYK